MEAEKHAVRRRRALGALAGLTLAGVVGAGLLASRPLAGSAHSDRTDQPDVELQPRQLRKVMEPWTKTKCQYYPWLKFVKPLYKHLANKGRPYGEGSGEGLVYETIDMGTGAGLEQGRKVLLILNATNFDYKPFSPRMNGMQGKFYGSVNLNSGSHLDLKMHFYDKETMAPLTMEDLAITFFDLDMGHGHMSQESVAINGFQHYFITPQSEVKLSNVGLGMTQFAASTFGDGADNPTDPMTLTAQQQNRAVTLLYKKVHEIDVTLRASPNNVPSPRFFTFVLRPSLLCAIKLTAGQRRPEAALDYTPPMEVPQPVPDHSIFDRWMVKVGDQVQKGDTIAYVQDISGTVKPLKATNAGYVKAIQWGLKHGESCDNRLVDTTIAVIERPKLPALAVERPSDRAAQGDNEETFIGYEKDVGDIVDEGETIATVRGSNGKTLSLRSPKDGIIAAEQTHLKPGDPIERIEDENLATLGRFPALPRSTEEHAVVVPPNSEFVNYIEPKGKIVQLGTPIATIKSASGIEQSVKATQAGVIVAEQEGLVDGMKIDDVMTDRSIATIGKLPPLEVHAGEGPAEAPAGNWRFKEYVVKPREVVKEGDTVAVVENNAGVMRYVKASKAGSVVECQGHLKQGYVIDKIMKDRDLCVIGKFPSLQVSGPRTLGVKAPEKAIFKKWLVEKGDHVEQGDPIAEVIVPSGGRRLQDGRLLQQVTTIPSPGWGTVTQEQPLKSGESIANQQVGPTIATIDMGTPWWVTLLTALCLLCCILCCLFAVMKKPKPAYTPMPPVEEPAEPPPEPPKPEGLRLDFEDEGTVHTVYARYRPLGIKHNDIAPIIAHDFTVNSYAKQELGVKDGWKLRRIDDEELNDNPNFEEVNSKLANHMKDFQLWPLPLEFKTDSGATKEIKFLLRPIGLEFSNKAPIKVSKIYEGSPAADEGVQEGWHIVRIGEMDVTENHNFREVMHHFKEGVQPLDDSGKRY